MGKRPAPKSEPSSPMKRPKTESATPNPETAVEVPVMATKFTLSYDTAASRKGIRREDLLKTATRQEKVINPYPELPVDEQLIGDYTVSPASIWNSMSVYSNCIITNITYRKNEYVYIRTPATKDGEQDMKQYWVGRILQIRARDAQNVFALVSWMYWPEEIPEIRGKRKGGRQSHHGQGEVVASNYLDVVEVLSFAGHASISYWDESNDEIKTRLFYRQTLNRDTLLLSKIREHCVCRGTFNPDPDKSMYICDNKDCGLWLHEECVIKAALTETWEKVKHEISNNEVKATSKKQKEPYEGKLSGKIRDGVTEFQVEVTNLRPGDQKGTNTTVPASCLKCHAKLLR